MSEQQAYMVSGYESEDGAGVIFTFVPRSQGEPDSSVILHRVPKFVVSVRDDDGDLIQDRPDARIVQRG